jgi:hypothetical protein
MLVKNDILEQNRQNQEMLEQYLYSDDFRDNEIQYLAKINAKCNKKMELYTLKDFAGSKFEDDILSSPKSIDNGPKKFYKRMTSID